MLAYLFSQFSPDSSWLQRVTELIINNSQINPIDVGFPADWKQRAFWEKYFAQN